MADQLDSNSATVPAPTYKNIEVDDSNEVTVKGPKFV